MMKLKQVDAVFQSDGDYFIARCLDLPVTTQGKTLVEAKKNLKEAVELYWETWGEAKLLAHNCADASGN